MTKDLLNSPTDGHKATSTFYDLRNDQGNYLSQMYGIESKYPYTRTDDRPSIGYTQHNDCGCHQRSGLNEATDRTAFNNTPFSK
ncbi:hypothetical protein GCM10023093_22100 [Nemorincola caseinilytica]|uniref:Uncharacterized protein n=1 Tax=Nemorincola caseinilytica TaxID=2054315 RepID=A0ABP8NK50_9BACT